MSRRDEILDTAGRLFATSGYMRTSLKDVADECGILTGSLYHHFASKESVAIELIARYVRDLDLIGRDAAADLSSDDAKPGRRHALALVTRVANAASRHRGALQLRLYAPRNGADPEWTQIAEQPSTAVLAALTDMVRRDASRGGLQPDVEAEIVAEQIIEAIVAISSSKHGGRPAELAELIIALVFGGVAADDDDVTSLGTSAAMRVAVAETSAWQQLDVPDPTDKAAALRDAARAEFARRGYDATTVRDVAAAAGIGAATVYRLVESKEALLVSILSSVHARMTGAYGHVLATESNPIEKLYALAWVNVSALARFREENAINRAWRREQPPSVALVEEALDLRRHQLGTLLAEGLESGHLRIAGMEGRSIDRRMLTTCVRELMWPPALLVERVGRQGALAVWRSTVLRGAARRDPSSSPGPRRNAKVGMGGGLGDRRTATEMRPRSSPVAACPPKAGSTKEELS